MSQQSNSKRIAVIEGDGIGKEVVSVGVALLERLAEARGYQFELVHFDLGADRFLRDGATFPEEDQQTIRETCDAVLLGALGDPRVPSLDYARDILFGLRFGLDLYCNMGGSRGSTGRSHRSRVVTRRPRPARAPGSAGCRRSLTARVEASA